jgi:NAD(P)-dependent dehydrogenase (short-subunit alcohol dehydrogenase family)
MAILVIGASRGIGLEFVRQYRAAGDRVIATARDDVGLERTRDLGAEPMRLDVANPASMSGLSWQLDGEKLDVALYVAGVIDRGSATTPPTQQAFDQLMHTNVLGLMLVIPQVLPMVEEAGGVFGALSSAMSQIGPVPGSNSWMYRVSKAALNMAVSIARFDYPKAHLGGARSRLGADRHGRRCGAADRRDQRARPARGAGEPPTRRQRPPHPPRRPPRHELVTSEPHNHPRDKTCC